MVVRKGVKRGLVVGRTFFLEIGRGNVCDRDDLLEQIKNYGYTRESVVK